MKVTVEVSFVIDDRPGNHAPVNSIAKDFKEEVAKALRRLDSDYKRMNVDCAWRDMDITVTPDEISATTRNKEVLT